MLPGHRLVARLAAASLALAGCYDGRSPAQADDPLDPAPPDDAPPLAGGPVAPLELDALSPDPAPGHTEFVLRVTGAGFSPGSTIVVDGEERPTTFVSPGELLADVGPLARGEYPVVVRRGRVATDPHLLAVDRSAPRILVPAEVTVDEDHELRVEVDVVDVDEPAALRVHALGLPPGAVWDEAHRLLRFTPDFTQGGARWPVTILATDGVDRVEAVCDLVIRDTIAPPEPIVTATDVFESDGYVRYTLSQVTDDYLDSPGFAGRTFAAKITVPLDALPGSAAVRVGLHGFATAAPNGAGSASEIRIAPHDPDNTYWWGYAASLPDAEPAPGGAAPDYTARRVLHLVEYVLRSFPEADPERVYLFGSSMGGAGAMQIGLLRARHFAYVDARLGQAIPRNHRPARLAQLAKFWGDPELALDGGKGLSVWDRMDLTHVLATSPEARDQFLFLKHGKDDATIHFGAAVHESTLTARSLYDALQERGVGHYAVWDEGGHGTADPVLGTSWYTGSWAPMSGEGAALRRDRVFPAFSFSSLDDDPGLGEGNGKRPWSDSSGFAGVVAVAGDTGWEGALAGALNRFLRWDDASVVDTVDRLQIALRIHDGDGADPPAPGYPSRGDRVTGELPARVDVTPRRVRAFRCLPGERVTWSFGHARGEVLAAADGSVTIPNLAVDTTWTTLVLRRAPGGFATPN